MPSSEVFLLSLLLLLASPASAEIVDVSILGANPATGQVAYKLWIEEDWSGQIDAIDCRYAGMQDKPLQGVILALGGPSGVHEWAIYEPAYKAEGCTSPAQQKERLAEAKAAFAAAGVDISAPPVTVKPKEMASRGSGDKAAPLKVGGSTVRIGAAPKGAYTSLSSAHQLWAIDKAQDGYTAADLDVVYVDEKPAIAMWTSGSRYSVYPVGESVLAAAEVGGHIAFVAAQHWCGMRGCINNLHAEVVPKAPSSLVGHRGGSPPIGPATFDKVQILGTKGDLIAVKWIGHWKGSINCGYAGMDAFPTSHVALAVWDTKLDGLSARFNVYSPANSTEANGYGLTCDDRAAQEASLAASKAHFAEVGLDISTPHTRIPVNGESRVSLSKPGQSAMFGMVNEDGRVLLMDTELCTMPKGAKADAFWTTDRGTESYVFTYTQGDGDLTTMHLCTMR